VASKDRGPREDRIDEDPSSDPRTAKGKSLNRSEADLDMVSQVNSRDLKEAREDWKARTLEGYEGLIEATLDPDEDFEPED
jgi:hypothetical protein